MADWDSEGEGSEVNQAQPQQPLALSNKWDGEDEDDDVKESWEDEDDEKKDEEKKEIVIARPPKSKKKLAEKIAEKEQRTADEEEDIMTPEQLLADKLRRQKLQEESDLNVALDTFGVSDKKADNFNPTTKEEFKELCESLANSITGLKAKEEYPTFISDLVQKICLPLNSFDLKNVKGMLDNLYLEKQKLEKGDKSKKAGKGKSKARLNVETTQSRLNNYHDDYGYDDGDDFM